MSYEAWQKGYHEVKNIIHNDIGVTKEDIREVFRQIAKEEIQKIVSEKKTFIYETIREVIRAEMVNAVQDHRYPDVSGRMWSYGRNGGEHSFKDFFSGVMKEEIAKMLKEQFEIKLDIDKKD